MFVELRDIVRALDANQIIPFFQPIVEIRTGNLKGFEVLARWQHPEHGPILPRNFISLAESNGLIGSLTQQICQKAFLAAKDLPKHLTLSVNASPIQMSESTLPGQIHSIAGSTSFSLKQLIVEVTETALHHDLSLAKKNAGELREMGCKLAMDDFGTGYSSLRHLQSMAFDELKIDASFIASMTVARDSRKIVAAIVGLAQSLDLITVAEGVETEEQADMLIWLGCEQAQGWRYGRPQGAECMAAMIAAEPIAALPALATPGDDWATSSLEALPTLRMAQLQAIYDGAPVGLCFLDKKLRYVSLNKRLAEMSGISVRAHLGHPIQEVYPEWYPIFEPYLARALQGEAVSRVELHGPHQFPGGADLELLASYQPAWDEADEVIGVSISVLDITEHKRKRRSAARKTDPEAFLYEVNPEVPWVMDSDGNNLQVSSRWVQTTPLGKDRTRNLRWLEALHTDDLANTLKVMKHALRTGKPIDVEYRVMGIDGDWRWMRSTGSPRFGPSGEITRWYGSVEDIDDRKVKEQETLRSRAKQAQEDDEILAKGLLITHTIQSSITEQICQDKTDESAPAA
ncbi:PAS domain S-box [Terriglobus roseus DSM 18391]|uniref:PAS domain S-box n=1 Tax=Terriglobus roseus (strain DSM 18391 / NRRL B-41598 / KBS 63) TaxID=926566 RepID=I3ZG42_TERRK|nr:EAL domain-containing protein [Terriglobus roseus]AFL88210.1 PAS domain S-box [Terriglobus roseus DSM 18391]